MPSLLAMYIATSALRINSSAPMVMASSPCTIVIPRLALELGLPATLKTPEDLAGAILAGARAG